MNISDIEDLKKELSKDNALDKVNKELLDDAIWYIKNGYTARAIIALKGVKANLINAGKTNAANRIPN